MKKFIKNNLKTIIAVIVTVFICSGVVYADYKYSSNEVSYKDGSVKEAIDELYEKATTQFEKDSWETIVANVQAGTAGGYYNVGDTKTVDMGDLGPHTVRIANMSTPSECSTVGFSQTACGFVLEFADIITTRNMNSSNINVGGWPASEMREYVNDTIYNALPTALKNTIIDTIVVSGYGSSDSSNFTSTDKLYLLSTKEVCNGGDYDTSNNTSRQLDYYVNNNVSISSSAGTIKKYKNSSSDFWSRSSLSYSPNAWNVFPQTGTPRWAYAPDELGVSPAFRIN